MKRLLICVLLLSTLFTAACKNPASKPVTKATVISVTISPELNSIEKGTEKEFSAVVEVTGKAAQTVKWTVSGTSNAGTVINPIAESNKAVLTVAADENAANITIKATSTVDSGKFDTLTLTITDSGVSVTVIPETVDIEKGGSQEFTANVTVPEGGDEGVTWTLSGNLSQDTKIDPIGETNKAILTVAVDESADSFTVIATSIENPAKSGTALVTVQSLGTIWLVGIPDWSFPPGTAMTQSGDTFIWQGDVAAGSTFRFSLIDTSLWDDKWNGAWYAPAADNTEVTLNDAENDMVRFDTDTSENATHATENSWKINDGGYYKFTVKPAEMKLRVELPVIVETVTVNGPNSAPKGSANIGPFTADVAGKNNPAQTVTWSIDGEQGSDYAAGTSIASTGILSVDANETSASLTVRATSTEDAGKSGSKQVTVTSAALLPTVTTLALSGTGVGTWSYADDANVTGYRLQLYKGTATQGQPEQVAPGVFTHNFLSDMRDAGAGIYSFTVTALGDNEHYATSNESEKSGTQEIRQRAQAVNLQWNGNTAEWAAGSGDVAGMEYEINLYKNNESAPARTETQSALNVNFSAYIETTGNHTYYFTVTAIGNAALVLGAETAKSPVKELWNEVWLVGIPDWIFPTGTAMTKSGDTFKWQGNAAADDYFKFSLTDTSGWGDVQNGSWFVPETDGTAASLDSAGNSMVFMPEHHENYDTPGEGSYRAWKIETGGYYAITVNPAERKFFLEKPVVVDSITILSPPTYLIKGESYQFNADISGSNIEETELSWSVNSSAGSSFGNGANFNLLSVAAGESAASLTITVSAGGESDSVTIDVLDPGSLGETSISLTVADLGSGLTITGGIPSSIPVIYKTGGSPGEDRITFAVANPNGSYSYSWYVGGQKKTGDAVTFLASEYNAGTYTVRLTVTINGIPWSLDELLYITVAAVK